MYHDSINKIVDDKKSVYIDMIKSSFVRSLIRLHHRDLILENDQLKFFLYKQITSIHSKKYICSMTGIDY